MNIAVISTMEGSPWGGSEELWASMVDEALNEGIKVDLFVYSWPFIHKKMDRLRSKGANIFFRQRPFSSYVFRELKTNIINIHISPYKKIFQRKPDVICINHGGTYDIVLSPDLLKLLLKYSIPYVVICHSNYYSSISANIRELVKVYFNQAERVIFVSNQTKLDVERQLAIKLKNSRIFRNPVNLTNLSKVDWPSTSQIKMACVGSLNVQWKGQDILFESLSFPIWRSRNWELGIYGEGPDRIYLDDLAAYYDISDRVGFIGYTEDIKKIWSDNHILLLPSRLESAPLVLVEAMICGRPSVVTDVGGIAEWVEDSNNGFIAEAPTTKHFTEALSRAWNCLPEWERIGISARKYALRKYDRTTGKRLLNEICKVALRI